MLKNICSEICLKTSAARGKNTVPAAVVFNSRRESKVFVHGFCKFCTLYQIAEGSRHKTEHYSKH